MGDQVANSDDLSAAEEMAYQLVQCSVALDQAWTDRENGSAALTQALNNNLELWIALRTVAISDSGLFSAETSDNLSSLARFVADKTFTGLDELTDQIMQTLININLQISEGILESAGAKSS